MGSLQRSARPSSPVSGPVRRRLSLLALLLAAACQTVDPVTVQANVNSTPALAVQKPADIAVLQVEDASPGGAASRHTPFLRQELMRQLVGRRYSPMTATVVDAAMKGNAELAQAKASGTSILEPARLSKLAGHCSEDALLALRIDQWDESNLMAGKKLSFRCQATMVGSNGQQLWFVALAGEIKAGGIGAAPRDLDGMARSCGEMIVRELMGRLPERQP